MNSSFRWHPDEAPPEIQAHSKAKLNVLRHYLRAYFDTLNVIPARDNFKLDLIDGFSGGGIFSDNGETIPGTPLIMLEETREAEFRLNQTRRKPLDFDCKFYFVDKEKAHTDHLHIVLKEYDHGIDSSRIVVRNGKFEDEINGIIDSIRKRQPRAGRSIFLLDQTGYAQVHLSLIRRIFSELPAAEVILTFAADALVNYLAETPQFVKSVAPLQLDESKIQEIIRQKSSNGGRALVQRSLREQIRIVTGAKFDTPFYIRPGKSRRALWFLHLSNHHTARDVMIQQHWNNRNTFEHYGTGDFCMLGWDEYFETGTFPLFNFEESDRQQLLSQLLDTMANEVYKLVSTQPQTVNAILYAIGNQTTAQNADINSVIAQLSRENEFDILDHDGKPRSRRLRILRPNDQVTLPRTPMLPFFSRRYKKT